VKGRPTAIKWQTLGIDLAIAVVVAAIILIVAPGLAVVGIVAIAILLVCAITLAVGASRRRRQQGAAGRPSVHGRHQGPRRRV
jgi:ABC-type bacteriocin/lantibiotic exporter with double-glycine peptidase domain